MLSKLTLLRAAFRILPLSLASSMPCAAFLFAQSPSGLLVSQFSTIDSLVFAFEESANLGKCDSARAASALGELLYQHPGFAAAAVTGHDGAILACAAFEGMKGELSGNVARREWFIAARRAAAPHYSNMVSINSRFYLVWSRPVYSNNALGLKTHRGIFTVFVNIGECLKNFSASYRRPFELLRNGILFFHSDDWCGEAPFVEEAVTLVGDVAFTLRYMGEPATGTALDTNRIDTGVAATPAPATETGTRAFPRDDGASLHERSSPSPGGIPPRTSALPWYIAGGVIAAAAAIGSASVLDSYRKRKRALTIISTRQGSVEPADAGSGESRASMIDRAKAAVYEEIRREIMSGEQASLREEARAKLVAEIMPRLRDEVGGALEREAMRELTRTIQAEVRAEHEKGIRERAFKDLDEQIRREVEVRERSLLLAQARAALKQEIETELRRRKWDVAGVTPCIMLEPDGGDAASTADTSPMKAFELVFADEPRESHIL